MTRRLKTSWPRVVWLGAVVGLLAPSPALAQESTADRSIGGRIGALLAPRPVNAARYRQALDAILAAVQAGVLTFTIDGRELDADGAASAFRMLPERRLLAIAEAFGFEEDDAESVRRFAGAVQEFVRSNGEVGTITSAEVLRAWAKSRSDTTLRGLEQSLAHPVAETAVSMLGDDRYAQEGEVDDYPTGTFKCNKFVYDVLTKAGRTPPSKVDENGTRWPYRVEDWSEPERGAGVQRVADGDVRAGDVVAARNPSYTSASGHMGVVVFVGDLKGKRTVLVAQASESAGVVVKSLEETFPSGIGYETPRFRRLAGASD